MTFKQNLLMFQEIQDLAHKHDINFHVTYQANKDQWYFVADEFCGATEELPQAIFDFLEYLRRFDAKPKVSLFDLPGLIKTPPVWDTVNKPGIVFADRHAGQHHGDGFQVWNVRDIDLPPTSDNGERTSSVAITPVGGNGEAGVLDPDDLYAKHFVPDWMNKDGSAKPQFFGINGDYRPELQCILPIKKEEPPHYTEDFGHLNHRPELQPETPYITRLRKRWKDWWTSRWFL